MVSDLLPNIQNNYTNLGNTVRDARRAGIIDWEAIEDRTRNVIHIIHWSDPSEIIQAASDGFKTDMWKTQPIRPEVWVEKDALLGVIGGVCEELRVPYFSTRGPCSDPELWSAAQRFMDYEKIGKASIIFHFADHDPSGVHMTDDLVNRLEMFRCNCKVQRIALNLDQVRQYDLPPNYAKEKDTNKDNYVQRFGFETCWELDALEPTVIADLIRETVLSVRDEDVWEQAEKVEREQQGLLQQVSDSWDDVVGYLEGDTR